MNISEMFLNAIDKNEIKKFLRGENEYMIETSQYSPEPEITDVGKVLSRGIYKVYEMDNGIKNIFEETLLQMMDNSDFDIYIVCKYLMSQLYEEKNGFSPFILSKDLIVKKLALRINERENNIKKGIVYPNGYINTYAMEEIQRFRKISREEYNVIF